MSNHQVRELQRLMADLQRSGHGQYKTQLAYVHAFLTKTLVFKAMVEHIEASAPDLDPEAWVGEHIEKAKKANHSWPGSEPQKMKVLWWVVKHLATDPKGNPMGWGSHLSYRSNFDEAVEVVTKEVVLPLANYLLAQIGTASEMIHLLGRFKRQVEWFEQAALFQKFDEDTSRGEDVYDRRLREFLFSEGIDYPYSQPKSASGKADVIAELEGDDPLVCEVKLYGGAYGVPYLAKGVRQVLRYAQDYGKAVGHLVIVNVSDKRLTLPTESQQSPPRIVAEGITVFMIIVHGKPRPSASHEGSVETVAVRREQLLTEISE